MDGIWTDKTSDMEQVGPDNILGSRFYVECHTWIQKHRNVRGNVSDIYVILTAVESEIVLT